MQILGSSTEIPLKVCGNSELQLRNFRASVPELPSLVRNFRISKKKLLFKKFEIPRKKICGFLHRVILAEVGILLPRKIFRKNFRGND